MRAFSLAAGCAALLVASAAFAQGGPMSVGLPSAPADLSMHCAAAVSAELYLVEEEDRETGFDKPELAGAMEAWVKDAAAKKGLSVAAMTSDKGFLAVTEDMTWKDAIRTAQVRWCLARTPR
ncbi:hypothetical protein [Caulobacter sp. NIBR1757]|uniref:hypothetical protein n=1 Tax=Caulobacter sp. NIBR1757 TaxID=3016000 RepID=UPI0022F12B42|nr:hypothetical protein [Caulobacter sp. NIBR1757]WGM39636.1 hypothetical protein AMEJIAPC_02561 [Caulobacter sp. NIBR1757]